MAFNALRFLRASVEELMGAAIGFRSPETLSPKGSVGGPRVGSVEPAVEVLVWLGTGF